jgi:hypothetical protein
MKLFDILKQFKSIEPDAQVAQRSRTEILLSPHSKQTGMRGVFAFLHVLETGAAVVLAGFFILILTGGFSGAHSIAPIQYSVIDPNGLHAEAQAIDMQIQLANVDYPQVTAATAAPVALPAATRAAFSRAAVMQPSTSSSTPTSSIDIASDTATSTPSSSITIDQALQTLSQ